jgi:hypothetical protein
LDEEGGFDVEAVEAGNGAVVEATGWRPEAEVEAIGGELSDDGG